MVLFFHNFFYFDDKITKYIIRRRPQLLDSTSTNTGNTVAGSIHIHSTTTVLIPVLLASRVLCAAMCTCSLAS